MEVANKPHVVCIPCPTQSHIKAMLKFAKLLHFRGFHITFVNTVFNHNRFLKSLGRNSLDGLPDFKFEAIPDGLPPSNEDATQDIASLSVAMTNNALSPFLDLVTTKLASNVDIPLVTAIVSDLFMNCFTITAAEELGIPVILFSSIAACSLMGYMQFSALVEKGLAPLKDEATLDMIIDWIPGMKGIRLKDLPSVFRTSNPSDLIMFKYCMEAAQRAQKASALAIHTFDKLERDVLGALSSNILPQAYSIGPLQLHLNEIPEDPSKKQVSYSLWKEDTECPKWLDTKPPNSVVYVNFGSITVMTPQQLVEFGMGLANSKHSFLWVIRPDLVVSESAVLPPEFVSQTKERGFITSWCPQEQVLNHPSVGGFLTHCGWSSILETISAGVPMLCWPFFADQQTNCWYACNEWGLGMEIDNDVNRDEVERLVRELMEGDKGQKMRIKAMEWKKLAEEATAPHGSSAINLDTLVNQLVLLKKKKVLDNCNC